ncbi:MAG: hypothetical protein mread185_000365 [Mycoplasmataceae bacterium]|nr:MAG: hypothetical protein mread185_000365 [Mycoplasmataceae bacterium]
MNINDKTNHSERIKLEIRFLREELRYKEQDKDRIWESYWWICWILLPFIGWIIAIITVVNKMNKSSQIERESKELREKIRDLEREDFERKYNKQTEF